MIYLILNDDQTIRAALHESCGEPEELHVSVDDTAWAAVSGYDHSHVRYVDGALVVDSSAVNMVSQARAKIDIARIEARQPRAIREAVLTGNLSRLKALDDEIAALRVLLQ